jgi:DNA-3-methyladenine glycosylase I
MPLPDGLVAGSDGLARCWWSSSTEQYQSYHDNEWGRPVTDDRRLFEKLCLEGFQSGLSWLTILKKRENFRQAFAGFDPEKVARFDETDIARLLADTGIVRHRGKIVSTINNARRALELIESEGSIAAYVWSFEPPASERPTQFDKPSLTANSTSPTSVRLSKDLKRRGWSFVGPTTVYAFMQAMGLVNDHLDGCHCRAEATQLRQRLTPPGHDRLAQ